ncbi:sulfite exporter TauE/SafE family protein [Bradyrhizobium ottawaense]|uniref:sulfite exporter TauE/SafE family protein n=1 Tax=Bradyrhizobium ottawaense TaxID=931866 RepID=UPI0009B746FF|nr:sulfite exporter TauE/SafE family protein [Bradyrhizobium ottawaense]
MLHDILTIGSGSLVGFVLGLVGGGGSILAVPLLVYVVGVRSAHVAIGTSSVAVALSALSSLAAHARAGNVRWPSATLFASCGVFGAMIGSTIGKQFDGEHLLTAFGALMVVVALAMLRKPKEASAPFRPSISQTASGLVPRLMAFGTGAGLLSGFFGIGGGFLVVPSLVASARLPLLTAIGSSLVSVSAFGLTTAANYALSGLVDWRLVTMFVIGGTVGSLAGGRLAKRLSNEKRALSYIFAAVVATVGVFVVIRSLRG